MGKIMQHLSMFKYCENELGYIQCVIKQDFKSAMEKLGFVDHIDKVKKPTTRSRKKKDDSES
jgi:hypothetical protein